MRRRTTTLGTTAMALLLAGGLLSAPGAAQAQPSAPQASVAVEPDAAEQSLRAAGFTTFPAPGSTTANPATQITFRGADVPTGTVSVAGATSGPAQGSWLAHSDGAGASFVPAAPFAPGEVVTVTGAGTSWTFTTSRPAEVTKDEYQDALELPGTTELGIDPLAAAGVTLQQQDLGEPAAPQLRAQAAPRTQVFKSRPDLRPPGLALTTATGPVSPGLNFALPQTGSSDHQTGAMIYDAAGEVVWFEPLLGKRVANLNRIDYLGTDAVAWFEGTSFYPGAFEGDWIVADTAYERIATIRAGNGYKADIHELTVTDRGTAMLIIYGKVQMDLTRFGGPADATVIEGVVQEVDLETGAVVFEWHSLDEIALEESYVPLDTNVVDYIHINSVRPDTDGDLLVSARHTSSVVKVGYPDADVVWRLGGRLRDFTFPDDVGPGFPHDAVRRADGTISVFDNGNPRSPQESRGVVWAVDEQNRTARKVREQYHTPDFYTAVVGLYRQLPNGNDLLSWGTEGAATEYRGDRPVWESQFVPPGELTYRTYRETGWVGRPSEPPAAAVERTLGQVSGWASWNGATEVAGWDLLGGPDARNLRVVGSASRDGFETLVRGSAGEGDDTFVLRARDAAGAELGASEPVQVGYSQPDAVYTTRGTSRELEVRSLAGGAWSAPDAHPSVLSDDPASAALDDGRWLYAVKGQPDGLYLRWSGRAGLQPAAGWTNLGGALSSAPSVAALPGGAATIVLCGTDSRVYQTVVSSTGRRGAWIALGGDCRGGAPSVARTPSGQVVVSAVGGDRRVRVRSGTIDGLRGWVDVGGIATSGTASVHFSDTVVTVVVRGSDAKAWSRDVNAVNGAPLGTWIDLGGGLAARPALAAVRTGSELRVLVLGTNGLYYERLRTGFSLGAWRRT